MIKNCTYIKKFTPLHKQLLEALSVELKMKNANEILLHTLEQFMEQKNEIARLKRIIDYKQNKINALKGE